MQEMPEVLTAHDIADILQITYPYALAFIKYSGVRYMKIGKQYWTTPRKIDSDKKDLLL